MAHGVRKKKRLPVLARCPHRSVLSDHLNSESLFAQDQGWTRNGLTSLLAWSPEMQTCGPRTRVEKNDHASRRATSRRSCASSRISETCPCDGALPALDGALVRRVHPDG